MFMLLFVTVGNSCYNVIKSMFSNLFFLSFKHFSLIYHSLYAPVFAPQVYDVNISHRIKQRAYEILHRSSITRFSYPPSHRRLYYWKAQWCYFTFSLRRLLFSSYFYKHLHIFCLCVLKSNQSFWVLKV
jgi:hypothetical protein